MSLQALTDELNTPERTPANAEMFAYYDMVAKRISHKGRGALIDMAGRLIWQEDYDAWQLRIKELIG